MAAGRVLPNHPRTHEKLTMSEAPEELAAMNVFLRERGLT